MFWYSKTGVNLLSFLITLIIFVISFYVEDVAFFRDVFFKKTVKISISTNTISEENNEMISKEKLKVEENENIISEEDLEAKELASYEWGIEIPTIDLLAPIEEGTSNAIMEQAVGHFEETASMVGNIGLAAHNRGYRNNYFARLKELKPGDLIYYKRLEEKRVYAVIQTNIIKDDDWSYLQDTKDNRLTLITCVENQPEYRRCVQAIEYRKEEIDEEY